MSPPRALLAIAAPAAAFLVAGQDGGLIRSAAAQFVPGRFEPAPVVSAGEVLPEYLLRSAHHRILDETRLLGHNIRFSMDSDYGQYLPGSIAMVAVRVHEVLTLAQAIPEDIQRTRKTEIEPRGQLRVGADSVTDILTSPFKTTGKLATQLGDNVGQTFDELGEAAQGQAPGGPLPDELPQYAAMIPDDPVIASHKRNVASQLRLDVYSSNTRVQSFLNSMAIARSGGRPSAGTTTVSITTPRAAQVAGGDVAARVRTALTRKTAEELAEQNTGKLVDLGVDRQLVTRFVKHAALSPTHTTVITEHLVFLRGVSGLGAVIEASLSARNEVDAVSYVQLAKMLALYHERQTPLARLIPAGPIPVALTRENGIVLVLPFDAVYWDQATSDLFAGTARFADAKRIQHREVAVAGIFTRAARRQLSQRGFEVHEQFAFKP